MSAKVQFSDVQKQAQSLEEVVLEKCRQLLGDDHPDTLSSMNNLAITYKNQELWKLAQSLEEVVLEKHRQLLGDDHPHTLQNINNLANTYRQQGLHQQAEALKNKELIA